MHASQPLQPSAKFHVEVAGAAPGEPGLAAMACTGSSPAHAPGPTWEALEASREFLPVLTISDVLG